MFSTIDLETEGGAQGLNVVSCVQEWNGRTWNICIAVTKHDRMGILPSTCTVVHGLVVGDDTDNPMIRTRSDSK